MHTVRMCTATLQPALPAGDLCAAPQGTQGACCAYQPPQDLCAGLQEGGVEQLQRLQLRAAARLPGEQGGGSGGGGRGGRGAPVSQRFQR